MQKEQHIRKIINARKRAKNDRERSQLKFIPDEQIFHSKLLDKLSGRLPWPQLAAFAECGENEIYRTCIECGTVKTYRNTCGRKWCPLCNWRIRRKRTQLLREWIQHIESPKHIVTTQRNFPILTRSKLREHMQNLAKLRRRKVFRQVKGGSVSVEITNEGKGWHVHAHWLVDAKFVDMKQLAIVWGKICGQEFGIVHYDEITTADYVHEVTKYVVEPGSMSDWPAEHVLELVLAIRGCRFFSSFGSLWKLGPEIRAWLKSQAPPPPVCACGCSEFRFETAASSICRECTRT